MLCDTEFEALIVYGIRSTGGVPDEYGPISYIEPYSAIRGARQLVLYHLNSESWASVY